MTLLKDKFPLLRTSISIHFTRNGEIFSHIDIGENIITNQGRANMAHLLAGDDVADRKVLNLKVGDGGHDPLNPTTAIAVSTSDTALFGAEVISKATSFSFPAGIEGTQVQFEVELADSEANGSGAQAISEVGLFDNQDRMMTHKTFGLITKSDAFGIIFRYRIIF